MFDDDDDGQYSTFEVAKIIGVDRERLRQWYQLGFVRHNTMNLPSGRMRHIFSRYQLEAAYAFKLLVDAGLTRKKAKQLTRYWESRTTMISVDVDVRAAGRCWWVK